jgi:trans-aconitate methyltransferase
MDDWTKGYIADVDYSQGYYRELTPPHLAFALLAKGIRPPNPSGRLRYCELGAGHGFTCNVVAATHPEAEVWATDFNPSFAATARRLAEAAGTPNLKVYDCSFEEFAALDLPQFDTVVLHGVYSWVMAEHRKAIVDFLRDKLAIGGVVYLSYNCLPGWAPLLPLRRFLRETSQRSTGTTEERIENSLNEAERLMQLGAGYFAANASAQNQIGAIRRMPRYYVAHEYFNEIWTPLYHLDVARQMHTAKLTFAVSADVVHLLDRLCLTTDQQANIAAIDDPPFRETVRDFMLNQQFRKDVFVRGPEALRASERRELLLATRFALCAPRSQIEGQTEYPQGRYALDQGPAERVLSALAEGPRSMGELGDIAAFDVLLEALLVLVGIGRVQPALPADGAEARAERAKRLNTAVLDRARHGDELQYLASPVLGGAIKLERVYRLFLCGEAQGHADSASFAYDALAAEAQAKKAPGKPVRMPNPMGVQMMAKQFEDEMRPLLRHHRIV